MTEDKASSSANELHQNYAEPSFAQLKRGGRAKAHAKFPDLKKD